MSTSVSIDSTGFEQFELDQALLRGILAAGFDPQHTAPRRFEKHHLHGALAINFLIALGHVRDGDVRLICRRKIDEAHHRASMKTLHVRHRDFAYSLLANIGQSRLPFRTGQPNQQATGPRTRSFALQLIGLLNEVDDRFAVFGLPQEAPEIIALQVSKNSLHRRKVFFRCRCRTQ